MRPMASHTPRGRIAGPAHLGSAPHHATEAAVEVVLGRQLEATSQQGVDMALGLAWRRVPAVHRRHRVVDSIDDWHGRDARQSVVDRYLFP